MATKIAKNTLRGVVALMGKQNVGKSTEMKHLCLHLLQTGVVTCLYPVKTPYLKLNGQVQGEANLVLEYKGKRVGIRGAGDSTRIIETAFGYLEKHQCEFAIIAVRTSGNLQRPTAAETAFGHAVRKRSLRVKPVGKIVKGDQEIQTLLNMLDQLIAGK